MKIWTKQEIIARFDVQRATRMIEQGFIACTQRCVQMPSAQHLQFPDVNGDCCIKSGHVLGTDMFAVKMSTGFYANARHGLPTNNGLIALFSAQSGKPVALLQDEGWLTCIRTAIAGQLVARIMAPRQVKGIGIVGAGVQGRLQLEYLKPVTDCRNAYVWSPDEGECRDFAREMGAHGFDVHVMPSARDVAENANLIVTATPSHEALLRSEWILDGTHVTAIGADHIGKQELDPAIVARAGAIVVDSIEQCSAFGEISHALKARLIRPTQLLELGAALKDNRRVRSDDDAKQLTVADLTGLAIQDAQIALSIVSDQPIGLAS